jgi:MarR family transcriptional regulator, organic hydroperoxide resistance regulator
MLDKSFFLATIHDISCIVESIMDQTEELRYLMLVVQREGNRQLTDVLRPLRLTPSQAEVIQVLQQYQPMTLLQLGERLVCENGSPSRLVQSMVDGGWVEKSANPNDGRAVLLQLTPAAEAILPELNAIEQQFNDNVLNLINKETLSVLLEKIWPMVIDSPGGKALLRRKHQE